jgi:hypothetical protein
MSENFKIVKVKKDNEGFVTDVMFDNGAKCPINHAILLCKQGAVEGYNVVRGKDGGEFLSADPNSKDSENLDDLPLYK